MTHNLYHFKKILSTLLGVFFTCAVFATNGLEGFYVKKGTQLKGEALVFVSGIKKENNEVFYVKEKTVFHIGKNKNLKVVYLSSSKEKAPNEKLVTSFRKQKIKESNHKFRAELKSFRKFPLSKGGFKTHNPFLALVLLQGSQSAKRTPFANKTGITNMLLLNTSLTNAGKVPSNKYTYSAIKDKNIFLSIYHCRPPPVA
jgi:hypothetical protein